MFEKIAVFNPTEIPYFPFKLNKVQDSFVMRNPVTQEEFETNGTTRWLLSLCDGFRTWEEIISEIQRASNERCGPLTEASSYVLETLTNEGLLWWRKQRMNVWHLPAPAGVLWDLTNRCNLHCRHCVVDAKSGGKDELDTYECKRVIDDMVVFGVKQLILSGGEPLIRPDFFDIARHAVKRKVAIQVATNATLITEEVARMLRSLKASTQVSLDGAKAEVHDSFRQSPGSWKKTMQGISYLNAHGVPVMIAAVATKANISQIPEIYDLAVRLRANTFRIMPFVPFGRGAEARELEVSPLEMKELTSIMLDKRREGSIEIAQMEFECTFSPPPPLHKVHMQQHIGCDGAIAYCTITSAGEVLPCNYFAGAEAMNVKEHNFYTIWLKSRFLNYFRSLTISDIRGNCRSCSWLSKCRGSCIAPNFARNDIFQSNCHCWKNTP